MASDRQDDKLNNMLEHVEPGKRAFIKTLIAGAGFAAPTVLSFSMKGISTYTVHAQGGSNITISDRNQKEAFAPVDTARILAAVAALPIESWQYKGESRRHIGPMAQDFAAAFQVGPDDRHIDLVDANGIALAAIQALARQIEQQNAEIAALKTALAAASLQ